MSDDSTRLGVLGGGAMGAGIAQLGALAGCPTLLLDPIAEPEAVLDRIRRDLGRGADRGRWTEAEAAAASARVAFTREVEDLRSCAIVIEAIPERLDLKQAAFAGLEAIVEDRCVLATNTSSLSVTAIAEGLRRPERVVGMHFFNPAPLMALVEIVAGASSAPWALERVRSLASAMGRRAVDARDVPGFLVNRCNRPFGLEALELVAEGIAEPELIDRIVRLGGGFPMGPFELQDLIGLDVSRDVGSSLFAAEDAEPRWRPSPLLARAVEAGRLGRKSGEGWYRYPPGRPADPPLDDAEPAAPGSVHVRGESALAAELRALATASGWAVVPAPSEAGLVLDTDPGGGPPPWAGPTAALVAGAPLAALDRPGAIGFHALVPLSRGGLVELTAGPTTAPASAAMARRFFAGCGLRCATVGDAPGLVLGRIVAQLVNEAAFTLERQIAGAADIDAALVLGVGYPRGPLGWADVIGLDQVVAILDGLRARTGDARYRVADVLRERLAAAEPLGAHPQ